MNFLSNNSRGADDLFANSSEETVIENLDFSHILEKENVLTTTNHTNTLLGNKFYEVPVDLHEATVIEAVHGKNCITKEIIAADKSFIANHTVTNICNFPLKLYCPFCYSDSMFENRLKGHIRNEHASHLERISVDTNTNSLHSCQLSHTAFYTDLVIKHILQCHQDKILSMFQKGEANKYVTCGFCPYMVLAEHKQHLLAHIEQTHFKEFRIFIKQKFTQITHCEKLENTLDLKNSSLTFLSTLFMQMSTKENKDTKKSVIDNSKCRSSPQFNQNENQFSEEYGIFFDNRKVSKIKNVKSGSEIPVRRKLRFDLPKTGKFNKSNKENIISCSTNMKLVTKNKPRSSKTKSVSTWKSVFSFKGKEINRNKSISKFVTSTPNTFNELQIDSVTKKRGEANAKLVTSMKEDYTDDDDNILQTYSTDVKGVILKTNPKNSKLRKDLFCGWKPPAEAFKQFECAICLDTFVNNVDFLTHMRRQHTGPLKLLQPSYKCGLCKAKFYKNSYLVRHCRFHHTPRCLKNQ